MREGKVKWYLTLLMLAAFHLGIAQNIRIGSKNFPESRLLCELMAQTIESEMGLQVERKFGLGGTLICFEALKTGAIDLYPEYTGTIETALMPDVENPYSALAVLGIEPGPEFGFDNTYVVIARPKLGLETIADLKGRTDLKFGFSNEFLKREDGFQSLNEYYALGLGEPRGLNHGLAYKALASGEIDVTDAYSTDGKLKTFRFQMLKDNQNFFPTYRALPLIRTETIQEYPAILTALKLLEGRISEETMRSLNYLVEVEKMKVEEVAYRFLREEGIVKESTFPKKRLHPVLIQTLEHLQLTFLATLFAVLIAVPAGIYISYKPKWSNTFLSVTGTIQTIPSLALLGFMIPLFGIGFLPAVIALFLYALLPVVRNTFTGLQGTDPILVEAGRAMGMTRWQLILKLRLPLAASVIMAGVRTAITINIGTATLAAFIGAGGLGESIITGITLNDNYLILQGAIPAALLALLADWGMGKLEKRLAPPGNNGSQQ